MVLRASGNDCEYREIAANLDVNDIVSFAARIEHRVAPEEHADADGLLLFQGAEFNSQIPVKVYEYLRIDHPILAFADSNGETASLLAAAGNCPIASLTDEEEISPALTRYLRN